MAVEDAREASITEEDEGVEERDVGGGDGGGEGLVRLGVVIPKVERVRVEGGAGDGRWSRYITNV